MRWAAALLPLMLLGCGGDDTKPRSIGAVKTCLRDEGLRVIGGPSAPAPDDTNAPDRGELITTGAFIAFYSSEQVAERLSKGVKANAAGKRLTVDRKGAVTVLYIDTRSRGQIEACLGS
jgi:hypothetical protein